jgi:chromosome segregation ATPase
MPIAMRTCVSAAISLTVLLFSGCADPTLPPSSTARLEEPVVQPEPCSSTETTSLQRYQELNQQYEAEKKRSAALAAELDEQKAGRQKAEAENESLRHQVESLTAKAAELDLLKTKFDEAQKTAFEVENSLRDVRRQLLEERLAGVKREETIVALKIERAEDLRKSPVERALQPIEQKLPQETGAEKPASQNGPVSGGNAVVNP